MSTPNPNEIWLVRFPFSDLTTTKIRPALVLTVHREEFIILGIFSRIPSIEWRETWVLVGEESPAFSETGLKKTSVIRADKITTVNRAVFQQKLGDLPFEFSLQVQISLKKALNME